MRDLRGQAFRIGANQNCAIARCNPHYQTILRANAADLAGKDIGTAFQEIVRSYIIHEVELVYISSS